MKFRICFMLAAILAAPSVIMAQMASLRGQVTDETGGVVPAAMVTLNGPAGLVKTATTDGAGKYEFIDLPPGDYTVQASAPKLALPKPAKISLKAGEQALDLQLKVSLAGESVTVQENTNKVSIDATNNARARVLSGDD